MDFSNYSLREVEKMAMELYVLREKQRKGLILIIDSENEADMEELEKKLAKLGKKDEKKQDDNEVDFRNDSDDETIEPGSPPVAISATIPHNYYIYTNKELEKLCKTRGITGYSKQTKAKLIDLLTKNDNK